MVYGLLGAGANVGVLLPFSRSHESEADHIGIFLMAAAGYDPHEASRFWMRMTQATGAGGPNSCRRTRATRRASPICKNGKAKPCRYTIAAPLPPSPALERAGLFAG